MENLTGCHAAESSLSSEVQAGEMGSRENVKTEIEELTFRIKKRNTLWIPHMNMLNIFIEIANVK